jgi:hypothetical protein
LGGEEALADPEIERGNVDDRDDAHIQFVDRALLARIGAGDRGADEHGGQDCDECAAAGSHVIPPCSHGEHEFFLSTRA